MKQLRTLPRHWPHKMQTLHSQRTLHKLTIAVDDENAAAVLVLVDPLVRLTLRLPIPVATAVLMCYVGAIHTSIRQSQVCCAMCPA